MLSPPCQPYTRRGARRDAEDPRASSFLHLISLLQRMKVFHIWPIHHDLYHKTHIFNCSRFCGSRPGVWSICCLDPVTRTDVTWCTTKGAALALCISFACHFVSRFHRFLKILLACIKFAGKAQLWTVEWNPLLLRFRSPAESAFQLFVVCWSRWQCAA